MDADAGIEIDRAMEGACHVGVALQVGGDRLAYVVAGRADADREVVSRGRSDQSGVEIVVQAARGKREQGGDAVCIGVAVDRVAGDRIAADVRRGERISDRRTEHQVVIQIGQQQVETIVPVGVGNCLSVRVVVVATDNPAGRADDFHRRAGDSRLADFLQPVAVIVPNEVADRSGIRLRDHRNGEILVPPEAGRIGRSESDVVGVLGGEVEYRIGPQETADDAEGDVVVVHPLLGDKLVGVGAGVRSGAGERADRGIHQGVFDDAVV